jgi:hypothetical protein
MYFPLKDQNDIFRIGVAVSDKPYGPFIPEKHPMMGSYSIDPCIFEDNGKYYMYFGGIWGGQLQRYRDNKALESAVIPENDEPAIHSKVALLSDDMLEFAEAPKDVVIIDENGKPLLHGDKHRFFEASWMHQYKGKYYFSYSTGGKWYLFFHDSVPSGGKTWLRSMKVVELEYDQEGKIKKIEGLENQP